MTPSAVTELWYYRLVTMTCNITYTANSYVAVDMTWSKDSSTTIVSNAIHKISTTANLATAVSTITPTPGYSSPFPIYRCNTTFKITGNPTGSANNAPDYSKSTQLNSPISVICKCLAFSLFFQSHAPYMYVITHFHNIEQWCTTFFGRGPLIDLLNPSWAKQVSRPKSAQCLSKFIKMMCAVKRIA